MATGARGGHCTTLGSLAGTTEVPSQTEPTLLAKPVEATAQVCTLRAKNTGLTAKEASGKQ